ncbi:hypothetical protein AgCh_034325 [Apium graveolens]
MEKPKEGINEVFDRFNKLINDLQLYDKYYEAEEVNLKFFLALPGHFEQKISAIREGRDLIQMTLKILYGILKTYELELLQRKSLKANQGHVVDGSSALVVNDSEARKAYIAEGKSWDDTDEEDENEEFGNYALMALEQRESSISKSKEPTLTNIDLNTSQYKETVENMSVEMFHIHTSMAAATEEVSRMSKINEKLEIEKQELEPRLVELETVKQENEYLKNKLKCASEIEAVLREYHEKNKPCANIAIGLDYDALNNNKKNEGDKGKEIANQDVPVMLRKVDAPLFKACEKFAFTSTVKAKRLQSRATEKEQRILHVLVVNRNTSEEPPFVLVVQGPPRVGKLLVIKSLANHYLPKQELADEDSENKKKTTPTAEIKKKPMVNQVSKTPIKEIKTENAEKKKKNRNGKIGINKSNKFAFDADGPRK